MNTWDDMGHMVHGASVFPTVKVILSNDLRAIFTEWFSFLCKIKHRKGGKGSRKTDMFGNCYKVIHNLSAGCVIHFLPHAEFPGQGSNLHDSTDWHHCSNLARSLTARPPRNSWGSFEWKNTGWRIRYLPLSSHFPAFLYVLEENTTPNKGKKPCRRKQRFYSRSTRCHPGPLSSSPDPQPVHEEICGLAFKLHPEAGRFPSLLPLPSQHSFLPPLWKLWPML